MNKVRFKTRIFETVLFSLFAILFGFLFFLLALKVYDKSYAAFLCILICALIIFILFIILALLFYQYCEFVDGVFIFKCPLYVIKKVKVEEIVMYDRTYFYQKTTRNNIIYSVIMIYLKKPNGKIKYKYLCDKNSIYYHIYDKKDNYDKFIEIMNREVRK